MRGASGKTILLVDDDEDIRDLLCTLLAHDGYRVIIAPNGQDGLQRLQESAAIPDLIIFDLTMPKMNGSVFHAKLSQDSRFARIPTIGISAHTAEALADHAPSIFMRKPLDWKTVRQAVQHLCS